MLRISRLNEKQRRPFNQRIEILDDTRALCLENWPTEDEERWVSRWTFLVKKEGGWRIDRVMTGSEKAGEDICRTGPS